jgi:hypothetical protein
MKKLLIVIMLLTVSFGFGQEFGLFQIAPMGGLIFPENDWEMGFQVGAKANIGTIMDGKIGLFPVVSYWSSKYDWESAYVDDDWEYKLSNIKFGVDAHYDLSEYLNGAYAGAGLALNRVSIEYPHYNWNGVDYKVTSKTDSDMEFGISLLGGMNFGNFFAEARYDMISDLNTFGIAGGMYFDMKK